MPDDRTPAQVAEDCQREALQVVGRFLVRPDDPLGVTGAIETKQAITRALAARAWATAEEMIDLAAFDCTPATGPEARQKAERDRLRREFESLSDKR